MVEWVSVGGCVRGAVRGAAGREWHQCFPSGQLAAALAVGAALVGSVLRFNAMQRMGAVGIGIAAGAGTGIVTGLIGTAIV